MDKNNPNMPKNPFTGRMLSIILAGSIIVAVYVALENLSAVTAFFTRVAAVFSPFIWGIALAYMLHLLMTPLETRTFKGVKSFRLRRILSIGITVALALLVVSGLIFLIVPQFVDSVLTLAANMDSYVANGIKFLNVQAAHFGIPGSTVERIIGNFDTVMDSIAEFFENFAPKLLNFSVAFGKGAVNSLIALVASVYILADHEHLLHQVASVFEAFLKDDAYVRFRNVVWRANRAFSSFLAGKTIDSLIIGILCFIFMVVTGMPYTVLISVIIGVTNMVPTFGPIFGGVPSVLLILLVDPMKGLWFGIFVLLLQQFDGNILGPKILGSSIGINSLWILFSVVVFGAFWGVGGMLIGVPLFAVIYGLFAEYISARLARKKTKRNEDGSLEEPVADDAPRA